MACKAINFPDVTPARWSQIQAAVKAQGIEIAADAGEAEQSGIRIRWHYNRQANALTVQCLKKPFFVPESLVNSKLAEQFNQL